MLHAPMHQNPTNHSPQSRPDPATYPIDAHWGGANTADVLNTTYLGVLNATLWRFKCFKYFMKLEIENNVFGI